MYENTFQYLKKIVLCIVYKKVVTRFWKFMPGYAGE